MKCPKCKKQINIDVSGKALDILEDCNGRISAEKMREHIHNTIDGMFTILQMDVDRKERDRARGVKNLSKTAGVGTVSLTFDGSFNSNMRVDWEIDLDMGTFIEDGGHEKAKITKRFNKIKWPGGTI